MNQSDNESIDDFEEIGVDDPETDEPIRTRGRAVNAASNFMSGRYIILTTRPINPDIQDQVNQCAFCQGEARLDRDHTITFGLEKKIFRNAFYDRRGDKEKMKSFDKTFSKIVSYFSFQ